MWRPAGPFVAVPGGGIVIRRRRFGERRGRFFDSGDWCRQGLFRARAAALR